MKNIFILLLLICYFTCSIFAQSSFRKSYYYGSPANQSLDCNLHKCTDGGFIVSFSRTDSIIMRANLIKTDSLGNIQWTYQNPGYNGGSIQLSDSVYILISSDGGLRNYITALDNLGNVRWMKYTDTERGFVSSATKWNDTIFFFKIKDSFIWIDDNGNIVRQNKFTGISDGDNSIFIKPSGKFYLANFTASSYNEINIAEFDSIGNFVQRKSYKLIVPPSNDTMLYLRPYHSTILSNGDIVMLGGNVPSIPNFLYITYIICVDSTGIIKWSYCFNNADLTDVIEMPDSSLRLTGFDYGGNHGYNTMMVYFTPGQTNHPCRYFNQSTAMKLTSGLFEQSTGKYVFAKNNFGVDAIELFKTDTALINECFETISQISTNDLLINTNNAFLNPDTSAFTLRDTLVSLSHLITEVNSCSTTKIYEYDFPTFSIYPNPSFDDITIERGNFDYYRWRIVDVFGKCLLSGEKLKNKINLSEFSSGIYYMTLSSNFYSVTKRIVKL